MIILVHLDVQTCNIKTVLGPNSVSLDFDHREMMGWIERVVGFGIRRPGLPADRHTEDFIIDSLHSFGIDQVITQTVRHSIWDESETTVSCWPTSDPKKEASFKALGVPYTIPTAGYSGELLALNNSNTSTLNYNYQNKIVMESIALSDVTLSLFRDISDDHFDPESDFDSMDQTLPFGPKFTNILEDAIARNASGYIGVLDGFSWNTYNYYVPYDGVTRNIHAAYIDKHSGDVIKKMLANGPVESKLVVNANIEVGSSRNIIGKLNSNSNYTVIIGTHHDAPYASAVEDGSGIALVLAQAKYWTSIPKENRPFNFVFLVTCGHMAGGVGTQDFIKSNPEILDDTVLEIHLEHVATECRGDGANLISTGNPEVRWWFTTQQKDLQTLVKQSIEDNHLTRSLILKPDVFMAHPPTDGGFFHLAGVPIVNFLTAPMYLFDSLDTIDKIHVDSLEPLSRAVAQIINGAKNIDFPTHKKSITH